MSDEALSTQIDTAPAPSEAGAGAPEQITEPVKEAEKPSLRDTIAAEVKDEAKPEKTDGEAKGEKKADDAGPDEKTADKADAKDEPPVEKKADDETPEAKEEKAKKPTGHFDPPKQFQADAREVWRNVPRAVQRDIDSTLRSHEEETTRLREATERYEAVRQYDELARANGRELSESLARVAEIEDAIQANPIAGLNKILMEIGPRKADGQPVSLFEVATHIVSQGQQGYQQMVSQAPQQQQPQENPEVAQLREQISKMQEQQIETAVILPFKNEHPRYEELQDDIAMFLKSGKVPSNLSASDRLAVAYDMAVRINPASHDSEPASPTNPDTASRADTSLSGSKSIKSTPGAVSTETEPDRGGSIQDLLRQEMKRAKRA